ncbi:MAG: phosphoenolpyruvate--protein phosphotransferase [Deltaproteobacteria bacterium]|nr:phosphoenolpyruvate--protein phosphotransferase [Deltaproteobacteria bacterium]
MSQQLNSLKTISTVTRILQKSNPQENPLAHVVSMVKNELGVEVCSLYLLQNQTLILVASEGLDPNSIGRVRMNIHEGLTGLAVENLQPVIVKEASLHPRYKFFPETGEEQFCSFVALPLIDREKVLGVLTLQTTQPREFKNDEIEMLKIIVFQLAGVIQNLVTLEVLQVQEQEKDKLQAIVLKGIGVAPGFGIGACFLLKGRNTFISYSNPSKKDPKREWKKVEQALDKASKGLLGLEKKLLTSLSKKESDIFYSHRMILSDKSFHKKIKTAIEEGQGAAQAVFQVIDFYIAQFLKIEDPHFRERSADLEDLRERVLEHLLEHKSVKKTEALEGILVTENLVPSDTINLNPEKIFGIVSERGGLTSHAAILACSLGIPAVMGIPNLFSYIQPGNLLIVDGNQGKVIVNPDQKTLLEYERIQESFADQIVHLQKQSNERTTTLDKYPCRLEANVGILNDLKKLRYFGAEGVGLYRTEMPFISAGKLPDEEEQFRHYKMVLELAEGLPVTFRILDAGGDKPIQGLNLKYEANPFLGYRSIRLSLSKPDILKTQFRALLRASIFGTSQILVPMISSIEEIQQVHKIFEEVKEELCSKRIEFNPKIPFGIMIEVPSAVRLASKLCHYCDFMSLGTNDLIQYTLAVDRNNAKVAAFFEPLHPAVLSSIHEVAQVCIKEKKKLSVCGEMAGSPRLAMVLMALGVQSFSMAPLHIPLVKNRIRQLRFKDLLKLGKKLLRVDTLQEIEQLIVSFEQQHHLV